MRLQALAAGAFGLVFWASANTGCGGGDGGGNSVCGDGACSGGETAASCPADCSSGAVCGDGACNGNENASSCPGDCPTNPVCGDHTCNGNETTANCPSDCPCSAATQSTLDTCTGEDICINGACVSAFGRNYQIVIGNGTMTQDNAAGDTWDALGGLPDPFVVITLNGAAIGQTSTKDDTLTPTWNEQVTAVIAAGSSFQLDVFDEDVAATDSMFGCIAPPLTADVIRSFVLNCPSAAASPAGVGSSITFFFVPL